MSLFVAFMFLTMCAIDASDPAVKLDHGQGTIIGKRMQIQAKETNYEADVYLGIPYAEPPVGELRFKPPVPKDLTGEFTAQKYGKVCPQAMTPIMPIKEEDLSEDCLFLQVYVPVPKPSNAAVMLWIHGGGYQIGAGGIEDWDLYPMAAIGEVIIVTINYRLGILGFLNTGDESLPGNYGMLDQVEAMKWVQKNIRAFGGDPGRVTIFGESAGSGSVSLHTLSPLSKGLFSRAIMQSGTAYSPWAMAEDTENYSKRARTIGELAGCNAEDVTEMIACLVDTSIDDLMNATNKANEVFIAESGVLSIGPAIDGYFLPEAPSKLMKKRLFNTVDLMVGYNADEGTMYFVYSPDGNVAEEKPHLNATDFDMWMMMTKVSTAWGKQPLNKDAVELTYLNDSLMSDSDPDYFDAAVEIIGDFYFACPSRRYLGDATEAEVGQIYAYYFNHHPSKSIMNSPWSGACHGDDLFFFGIHFLPNEWNLTEEEVEMTITMIRYWTNFAKTGNPNTASNDEQPPSEESYSEWPQYTLDKRMLKELSPEMKNILDPRAASCKLWNDFIPNLEAALDEGDEHKSCKSKWVKDGDSCEVDAKP